VPHRGRCFAGWNQREYGELGLEFRMWGGEGEKSTQYQSTDLDGSDGVVSLVARRAGANKWRDGEGLYAIAA